MLADAKSLFEKMLSKVDNETLRKAGIDLASAQTRLKTGGRLSVALGTWCKLAKAASVNPAAALMSLMLYRMETSERERLDDQALRNEIAKSFSHAAAALAKAAEPVAQVATKTLTHFPDAFEPPFILVTGDRRETEGWKMTPADFGVLSSSPADIRFLSQLGLTSDFEIITDKIFVLAPEDELVKRFSNATLICCGSPATNHLARILNRFSLFRFSLQKFHLAMLEGIIADAWHKGAGETPPAEPLWETDPLKRFFVAPKDVAHFDYNALCELRRQREPLLRWQKYSVFSGGIIDPTFTLSLRGLQTDRDRDFGIISLAQNPFRRENDAQYPALYVAGYHLPGTCYALHRHIWHELGFEGHPLGGVIRVVLKPLVGERRPNGAPKDFFPFYERMERFDVRWDDESDYTVPELREALSKTATPPPCPPQLSPEEAGRALEFVEHLTGS